MNTIWADRQGIHDDLQEPADLADWLHAIGALDHTSPITAQEFGQGTALRDSLRRLAALCADDTREAATSAIEDIAQAVAAVNQVAGGQSSPQIELTGNALRLSTTPTGPAATAALADVAVEAIALFTDEASKPVRACFAPGCVLYFVQDHPRREWCSTACGNRARAARHYQRHKST
jgi:predicted RNA-binding Zn ribbon-like protein